MERETLEQAIARACGQHFETKREGHDLWLAVATVVREWLHTEHVYWHGADCGDGCGVHDFLVYAVDAEALEQG